MGLRAHLGTCPPSLPSLRHTAHRQLPTDPPRRDAFQKDPWLSNVTHCGDPLKKLSPPLPTSRHLEPRPGPTELREEEQELPLPRPPRLAQASLTPADAGCGQLGAGGQGVQGPSGNATGRALPSPGPGFNLRQVQMGPGTPLIPDFSRHPLPCQALSLLPSPCPSPLLDTPWLATW